MGPATTPHADTAAIGGEQLRAMAAVVRAEIPGAEPMGLDRAHCLHRAEQLVEHGASLIGS